MRSLVQDPNNYWEQLERLEKLIKGSELKAGIIFSFHSLSFGIYVDRLPQFEYIFGQSFIFLILTILWMINALISIYYCFKCFYPQILKNLPVNVFFFKDAAHNFANMDDYSRRIMDVCSDKRELFKQLSRQIYVESKIIDRKFLFVHKSIRFLCFSLILLFLKAAVWVLLTF